MARLSVRKSIRPQPRDSIFTSGTDIYRGDAQATCPPNLLESVYAMEDCCEEAYEAQQILRNGTQDLPRMTRILENQRIFLLVDETTVKKYKADLTDEIEPQINELIERAKKGIAALEKQQTLLKTKLETARSRPLARGTTTATSTTDKLEARRLQMLVKQRERLQQELIALGAEVKVPGM